MKSGIKYALDVSSLKSEKLSVIGELAAGIAHEIRNPLTSIKGFINLLGADNHDEKKKMYFEILKSEVDRINFIVNEFMGLAKPHVYLFQRKDVIGIIKNTLALLESESNLKNVLIAHDFEEENITVDCVENQLKQVFLNITKNAIEAMPHGGNIHIKVELEKDKILIKITDSGIGISKERIKKLGEPLYTTKEKGTGFGLMVSFNIIEKHKGTVQIESEENKGTIFTIILPQYRTSGSRKEVAIN